MDKRYISNSILKYGQVNFSVVILDVLGKTALQTKTDILIKQQYYIDLYKPILNLSYKAGSTLGFKHTAESKKLIYVFKKDKPLSLCLKQLN